MQNIAVQRITDLIEEMSEQTRDLSNKLGIQLADSENLEYMKGYIKGRAEILFERSFPLDRSEDELVVLLYAEVAFWRAVQESNLSLALGVPPDEIARRSKQ